MAAISSGLALAGGGRQAGGCPWEDRDCVVVTFMAVRAVSFSQKTQSHQTGKPVGADALCIWPNLQECPSTVLNDNLSKLWVCLAPTSNILGDKPWRTGI